MPSVNQANVSKPVSSLKLPVGRHPAWAPQTRRPSRRDDGRDAEVTDRLATGRRLLEQGLLARAHAAASRALQLSPSAETFALLGEVLCAQGEMRGALWATSRALEAGASGQALREAHERASRALEEPLDGASLG